MKITVLYPIQQLCDQPGNIVRQRSEMQDMSLSVYHTDRAGTKTARLLYKATGHHAVRAQQISFLHNFYLLEIPPPFCLRIVLPLIQNHFLFEIVQSFYQI